MTESSCLMLSARFGTMTEFGHLFSTRSAPVVVYFCILSPLCVCVRVLQTYTAEIHLIMSTVFT